VPESDRPALGKMNITSLGDRSGSLQPAEWQNFGRRGGRHPAGNDLLEVKLNQSAEQPDKPSTEAVTKAGKKRRKSQPKSPNQLGFDSVC